MFYYKELSVLSTPIWSPCPLYKPKEHICCTHDSGAPEPCSLGRKMHAPECSLRCNSIFSQRTRIGKEQTFAFFMTGATAEKQVVVFIHLYFGCHPHFSFTPVFVCQILILPRKFNRFSGRFLFLFLLENDFLMRHCDDCSWLSN